MHAAQRPLPPPSQSSPHGAWPARTPGRPQVSWRPGGERTPGNRFLYRNLCWHRFMFPGVLSPATVIGELHDTTFWGVVRISGPLPCLRKTQTLSPRDHAECQDVPTSQRKAHLDQELVKTSLPRRACLRQVLTNVPHDKWRLVPTRRLSCYFRCRAPLFLQPS